MKPSERERINQLIRDEYPTGDLDALAKKCGYSAGALRQRASKLEVKRDKKVFSASISAARKASWAVQKNLTEYSGSSKPCELADLFRSQAALLNNSRYRALANIPEFIATECQGTKKMPKLPYLKRHIQAM